MEALSTICEISAYRRGKTYIAMCRLKFNPREGEWPLSPGTQDVSRLRDAIGRLALYAASAIGKLKTVDVAGFIASICGGAALEIGGISLEKILGACWGKIEKWASKRELAKAVRGLYLYRSADDILRQRLDRIPELIRRNADAIRDRLGSGESFIEIVKDLLATADDMELSEDYAEALAIALQRGISRVIASGVTPSDVYSLPTSEGTKSDQILTAVELLHATLGSHALARELVDLSFSTRLERIEVTLDRDALTAGQDESLSQHRAVTEPTFFRRPHLNWVDLERGYYYDRPKLVDNIEDKFARGNWLQLIVAPSGAGKTTLGLILGYRHVTLYGGIAYYVDLEGKSDVDLAGDVGEIAKALKRIKRAGWSEETSNGGSSANHDFDAVEEIPSILVIVDNIHLNLKRVQGLVQGVRSAYLGTDLAAALSILLLARVGHEDLQRGTEQILAELFGSDLGEGIVETRTLERRDFKDAVRGIADVFARERDIGDIKSFERDLVRKSQESLWLLSFVLRGLERGRSIEEINLCEEVEEFYYCPSGRPDCMSSVFRRVLDTRASDNGLDLKRLEPADARGALRAVLTTIAALGTLGTPVPVQYLVEAAQEHKVASDISGRFLEGNKARSVVNEIIERLRRLNEIVDGEMAGWNTVRLPHATLAEAIWSCAVERGRPTILVGESRDDDTSNATDKTIERVVLSLLDWCARYYIVDRNSGPALLPQVLWQAVLKNFRTSYHRVESLPKWFRQGEEPQQQLRLRALALALENHPEPSIFAGLLRSRPWPLPEAWQSLFKDAFLVAERPGVVLHAIGSFVARTPMMIAAIEARIDDLCAEITHPQESATVLWAISPFPQICRNERVLNAVATALRSSPKPWRILHAIDDWPKVRDDPKTVSTVRQSAVPRIAEALRSHPVPWWILHAIRNWPEVRDDPKIVSAIAEALRSGPKPWRILHVMKGWPGVQAHPDVRAAIDDVAEKICQARSRQWIPDITWESIVKIPQLRQHECIERLLSRD